MALMQYRAQHRDTQFLQFTAEIFVKKRLHSIAKHVQFSKFAVLISLVLFISYIHR